MSVPQQLPSEYHKYGYEVLDLLDAETSSANPPLRTPTRPPRVWVQSTVSPTRYSAPEFGHEESDRPRVRFSSTVTRAPHRDRASAHGVGTLSTNTPRYSPICPPRVWVTSMAPPPRSAPEFGLGGIDRSRSPFKASVGRAPLFDRASAHGVGASSTNLPRRILDRTPACESDHEESDHSHVRFPTVAPRRDPAPLSPQPQELSSPQLLPHASACESDHEESDHSHVRFPTVAPHRDPVPLSPQPQELSSPQLLPHASAQAESSNRDNFLKFGLPLYQAALQDHWAVAHQILEQAHDWYRQPIAKGGERVLHIAAAAKHVHFVKELVSRMSDDDLTLTNSLNNTALCFAATSGVVEIAKVMVEKNRALPYIRGSDEMPPLQMAVLQGHRDMVQYLMSVTKDSELTDNDRIAMLVSCIDNNLFDVAVDLLDKHPELAVLRDGKNETALHALARKPIRPPGYHDRSIWRTLVGLEGKVIQGKVQEQPLLLQLVHKIWNQVIKEEDRTISDLIRHPWGLLFDAAKFGNVEFLKTLIRCYPDVLWKLDENNCSIFHIAIKYRHEEIFRLIFEIGAIKDLIAAEKDSLGNTMLHLASALPPYQCLNCVSGAALQMQRELLWFQAVEKVVRPEYAEAENDDQQTPFALFTEEHEELRTKGEEWMKQTAQSCSVVAALIATVVFAGAFTLPGGVEPNGVPVFVNRSLFMVFSICNALSLFSSCVSILMFLSILTSRYAVRDFHKSLPLKLMLGLTGLFISMATMIAAFTVTFIMTFRQGVHKWIPIPIALFAAVPVGLFAFLQYSLFIDIYISTYRSWSLFKPTKSKLFR